MSKDGPQKHSKERFRFILSSVYLAGLLDKAIEELGGDS